MEELGPVAKTRGNIYKIQYAVSWKEGVEGLDRNMDLIRQLYDYMTPFVSESSRCSYLNYRDIDLGINEIGKASYEQTSS
uniref:Berberine/berberine-like domain-containing protein n=1 Tax=Salix viminalis TaxID=40686 RepID=A0A6N2L993_SALVM